MHPNAVFFGALINFVILQTTKADIVDCMFYQTANISSSIKLVDGSYLYQDLIVPPYLAGEYNYTESRFGIISATETHLRGCVCRLKPCIRFCCRHKDMERNGECTDGLMEELAQINPFIYVASWEAPVTKMNILEDFIVLRDQWWKRETWREYEYPMIVDGEIHFLTENTQTLELGIYETLEVAIYDCFHPNQFSSGNTESFMVTVHNDFYIKEASSLPTGAWQLILLSEVFLVLTIAVYLYVKKLRNLHGKCFVCYLIATFIYLLHDYVWHVPIPIQWCAFQGYCDCFFWMSKFNWLLCLSYQMWKGFTSVNRVESQYSFLAYNIYAWGKAAFLTGVIYLIDYIWGNDPRMVDWVPGVGWSDCNITKSAYIMTFYYTQVALNTAFFILTTVSIIRVKLSLKHFADREERTRNLSSRMQTYEMFVRLFIAMDLQWTARLIFYFASWNVFFIMCYYFEYCIGIIIFVLFVLKRRTLRLLMESIRNRRQ